MLNKTCAISVAIIVAGGLLIAYDDLYGPKDDILYLWPFPVMLLMGVAASILLNQLGALIFRWARRWPG